MRSPGLCVARTMPGPGGACYRKLFRHATGGARPAGKRNLVFVSARRYNCFSMSEGQHPDRGNVPDGARAGGKKISSQADSPGLRGVLEGRHAALAPVQARRAARADGGREQERRAVPDDRAAPARRRALHDVAFPEHARDGEGESGGPLDARGEEGRHRELHARHRRGVPGTHAERLGPRSPRRSKNDVWPKSDCRLPWAQHSRKLHRQSQ